MALPVASSTHSHEVLFRVVALLGTVLQVVHFKLTASPAVLACSWRFSLRRGCIFYNFITAGSRTTALFFLVARDVAT